MGWSDVRHWYEDYEEPELPKPTDRPRCTACNAFISFKAVKTGSRIEGEFEITANYIECKRCGAQEELNVVKEERLPDDHPAVVELRKFFEEMWREEDERHVLSVNETTQLAKGPV